MELLKLSKDLKTLDLKTLKKWKDIFPLISHPTRLSILIILQGAEILAELKIKKKVKQIFQRTFPAHLKHSKILLIHLPEFYFKLIRHSVTLKRAYGSYGVLWFAVWPIKFFVYLKAGKGILFPFSVEEPAK